MGILWLTLKRASAATHKCPPQFKSICTFKSFNFPSYWCIYMEGDLDMFVQISKRSQQVSLLLSTKPPKTITFFFPFKMCTHIYCKRKMKLTFLRKRTVSQFNSNSRKWTYSRGQTLPTRRRVKNSLKKLSDFYFKKEYRASWKEECIWGENSLFTFSIFYIYISSIGSSHQAVAVPLGACGSVRRQFWLSNLGDATDTCCRRPGMLRNTLWFPAQPPTTKSHWPKCQRRQEASVARPATVSKIV